MRTVTRPFCDRRLSTALVMPSDMPVERAISRCGACSSSLIACRTASSRSASGVVVVMVFLGAWCGRGGWHWSSLWACRGRRPEAPGRRSGVWAHLRRWRGRPIGRLSPDSASLESPLVDARRGFRRRGASGGRPKHAPPGRSGGVSKLRRQGPRSRGPPVHKRRVLSKALQPIRTRYVQEVNISACGGGFQAEAGTKSSASGRLSHGVCRTFCCYRVSSNRWTVMPISEAILRSNVGEMSCPSNFLGLQDGNTRHSYTSIC